MENRGKQRQVLFDGVQDCAQLYHLPLHVSNAMFDGLDDDVVVDDDDDDVPIPIGPHATTTDAAIAPVQPE